MPTQPQSFVPPKVTPVVEQDLERMQKMTGMMQHVLKEVKGWNENIPKILNQAPASTCSSLDRSVRISNASTKRPLRERNSCPPDNIPSPWKPGSVESTPSRCTAIKVREDYQDVIRQKNDEIFRLQRELAKYKDSPTLETSGRFGCFLKHDETENFGRLSMGSTITMKGCNVQRELQDQLDKAVHETLENKEARRQLEHELQQIISELHEQIFELQEREKLTQAELHEHIQAQQARTSCCKRDSEGHVEILEKEKSTLVHKLVVLERDKSGLESQLWQATEEVVQLRAELKEGETRSHEEKVQLFMFAEQERFRLQRASEDMQRQIQDQKETIWQLELEIQQDLKASACTQPGDFIRMQQIHLHTVFKENECLKKHVAVEHGMSDLQPR